MKIHHKLYIIGITTYLISLIFHHAIDIGVFGLVIAWLGLLIKSF